MTLTLPKTCSMGGSKTGLVGTIGVTLLNPDGTTHTARAIAGIYEIGGGCYGKEITFDDNWKGSIKWDTGGGSPVYATEDYDVEGLIDMIEEDTSKMNFTGTDIKATLDGEKVALSDATETQIDDIETDLNTPDQYKADISTLALEDGGRLQTVETDTNEMQGKLPTNNIMGSSVKTDKDDEINRILGLVHENIYIDNPSYDANKNLISARLRVYSVAGSVGTDNDVLATYTITAVGDGAGKFTSWKMVKQ